jgi:hypothetical protein
MCPGGYAQDAGGRSSLDGRDLAGKALVDQGRPADLEAWASLANVLAAKKGAWRSYRLTAERELLNDRLYRDQAVLKKLLMSM